MCGIHQKFHMSGYEAVEFSKLNIAILEDFLAKIEF